MSPRPKGRTIKSDLRERIIASAWQQIAREGTAALSLRAIARDLGIAAPSIYNYFPDRDALVTDLIVEAYESLGTQQLAARDAVPVGDLRGQMYAISKAYRDWAVTYPQRYQLIFGTPIPGYVAPVDKTTPSAARSLSALVSLVEACHQAKKLKMEDLIEKTLDSVRDRNPFQGIVQQTSPAYLIIAVLIWTRVHGLISVEISNNLPSINPQGSMLYQIEINLIINQFFSDL
jgi:AcrR family transcriptional regulator